MTNASAPTAAATIRKELLDLLQCPLTGQPLRLHDDALVSEDGSHRYAISLTGIPLFGDAWLSNDGAVQRTHYDAISTDYIDNLGYEHTREYMAYLDRAVMSLVGSEPLGSVAEICCGTGEGLHLLGKAARLAVGVDVSMLMLNAARRRIPDESTLFLQGD